MRSRGENGGALVYALVFLALCTLGVALALLLNERGGGIAIGLAVVALAIAAAGLMHEARRDLDAALTFGSVIALIVTIGSGVGAAYTEPRSVGAIVVAVVSGLIGLGLGAYTFRRQRSPESAAFPNVLARRFPNLPIFETDAVQYSAVLAPSDGTSPHQLSFLLQNCSDGPRSVTLRLDAGANAKYLRFQPTVEASLGPAEVVRVGIPVVSPTYNNSYPLFFSMSVQGSGGRRVRLWRGQAVTTRIKQGHSVALLAVGVVAAGGGVSVTVGPTPTDLWNTVLAPPVTEVLWRPGSQP